MAAKEDPVSLEAKQGEHGNRQGPGVVASCPFCSCRVESEGSQGPGGVPGVVPAGGGDAGVPGRFQDADGQVTC